VIGTVADDAVMKELHPTLMALYVSGAATVAAELSAVVDCSSTAHAVIVTIHSTVPIVASSDFIFALQ
jgi:hypothetical protein